MPKSKKELQANRRNHLGQKCIFCGSNSDLQKHHIYPRKFWKGRDNKETIIVCQHCHDLIHIMLFHLIDVLIDRGFMPPLPE